MRWIGIAAGLIGAVVGSSIVKHTMKGGASPDDLKPYTAAGLSLQFPAPPEKFEVTLPANVRALVSSTENYQYKTRNFEAAISRVAYVSTVQANPEGALEGALSNVATSQSMERVSKEAKPVTLSDIQGLRFTAVFRKSGQNVEAQGIVLADGPALWQLFVVYLKDNAASRETATKMVDSVRIAP